ncbi:MAG: response regulator [Acidobacteria bacterium]|nr:response regulator [Acidobacteriota bacterium]
MKERHTHAPVFQSAPLNSKKFSSAFLSPPNKDEQTQRGLPTGLSKEGRKPHALVVDDAPDVLEMLAILLRHDDYEVTTAKSAAEALVAAQGERFDIVVSDIGMPEMDGYQLAEALRALPGYKGVPLVAVTGFALYDDRERALKSGFNAHLTKPINPISLLDLLSGLRHGSH